MQDGGVRVGDLDPETKSLGMRKLKSTWSSPLELLQMRMPCWSRMSNVTSPKTGWAHTATRYSVDGKKVTPIQPRPLR